MVFRFIQAFLIAAIVVSTVDADSVNPAIISAPGYGDLAYELPEIGSYQLPPLGEASNGEVLIAKGQGPKANTV